MSLTSKGHIFLIILLCLMVFFGLAKLVAIPLQIDDFDSFRLKDVHEAGQGLPMGP